jgi:hypothetical protein
LRGHNPETIPNHRDIFTTAKETVMQLSKKWIVTASVITLGLSGCGIFGSNPVEGKWKVTSVTSNIHLGGMGYGSMMSDTMSSSLDGTVITFTGSKIIGEGKPTKVIKYVTKKNNVEIYVKGSNGAEEIFDGTLSNHGKDLSLKMSAITLHMQKIS